MIKNLATISSVSVSALPTYLQNTILNANAAIKMAFTTTPTYFGIGELGGAYSTSGSGSETENASIQMTIAKVSPLHHLLIGFHNGTALGNVATDPAFNLSLDVNINGTDQISRFTNRCVALTLDVCGDAAELARERVVRGARLCALKPDIIKHSKEQDFDITAPHHAALCPEAV
jgi:hypothetical protein